ncbi:MAG: hypothetical protein MUD10_04925 [Candidatus Pacebacteria bacterium]|nr:hypothetical protein [Candidatus Paceibacterota bacterium]
MKIPNYLKSIFIGLAIFSADKASAILWDSPAPEYGMPVTKYGVPVPTPDPPVLIWFPLSILLLFVSGIVSPIIGYRWYIKHGGTKKWLRYLAYAPLALFLAFLGIILFMFVAHNLFYRY